jgi:peptidoglycan hydrolase CwlO-like protein
MPMIPLVYASGKLPTEAVMVKFKLNRWLRNFMVKHAIHGEKEVVIHWNPKQDEVTQISLVDSNLDEQFQSNMDFEGQITELHKQLRELSNENKGLKMRKGKLESQVKTLKEKVEKYEAN